MVFGNFQPPPGQANLVEPRFDEHHRLQRFVAGRALTVGQQLGQLLRPRLTVAVRRTRVQQQPQTTRR